MAEVARTKSANWRCRQLYPALVTIDTENRQRARCLGCGEFGPPQTELAKALRALRDTFSDSIN